MDLSVSTTDLQLDSLRNITKIVITGYCVNDHRFFDSSHLKLSSLGLGLNYTNVHPMKVHDLPTLHRLLKGHAVEAAVRLKELDIKGV